MRYAILLFLTIPSQAATLSISPPVIYDCTGSVGKATIRWKDASGPVQLLVGPAKAVFTGFGGTSGSAETGTWVSEGLEFRLVNPKGDVEANLVARVQCNTTSASANGLVSESFFPLETGNQWMYRFDSRIGTAAYITWTVVGQQVIGGRRYAQIATTSGNTTSAEVFIREEGGMLYRINGTVNNSMEELYLNPGAASHAPFRNALGSYPDAAYQTVQVPLNRETRVFIRGVGLARSRNDSLTGSSGGFVSSMELVDFRLGSGPRVEGPITPRIAVSIESAILDVTGRLLTNCALPCYFAACGLGGGVPDPPGTYKPCARTRIDAAAEGDFQVELSLKGRDGIEVFHLTALNSSGDTTRFIQLPLYVEGNQPLSAGVYALTAKMSRGQNELGTANMPMEIR